MILKIYPLHWEPVAGSGEKICIGYLEASDEVAVSVRLISEEKINSMFPKNKHINKLLDTAIAFHCMTVKAGLCYFGVTCGEERIVQVYDEDDVPRIATLMFSGLGDIYADTQN